MPSRSRLAGVFAFALLVPSLLAAQSGGSDAKSSPEQPAAQQSPAKEFVTRHSLEIGGKTLRYRAVAGETVLKDAKGTPAASVFTISYLLDGVEDPSERPITFLFNGGPGSTAVWLHLGAFGPVRLDLGTDPLGAGAPPYPLRPNPHSLLDVTDLVFVDHLPLTVGNGAGRLSSRPAVERDHDGLLRLAPGAVGV